MAPERRADYLHRITQTGAKMDNIIQELLLLASVRKVDEVRVTTVAMGTVFQDACARLAAMFADHDAQLRTPASWAAARGYAPWVEEVWVNYLSNALKYGGQPPVIEVGGDVDGAYVRYWCRDNGPGLSAAEQSQLFAPFTRLHEVRAEGHGLGLSIVRRIVEKLGGQVGVESAAGTGAAGEAGSTFWFTLPRA
jgi:signal transduction histidine kinase